MVYSEFNSHLLLIRGCNLAIHKASLILRFPTLRTIVSISMVNYNHYFCFKFNVYGMRMHMC